MDYYKLLGVDKNASEADIKKAYRKFAHKYHPDSKGGGDEKKFKEVTEAYEVLSDKQKRAQYDQFGSVGKGSPWSGAWGGAQGFGGFGGFEGFQNVKFDFGSHFGDIFDTFFGGERRSRRKSGPAQGEDIELVLPLSFEESIFGATKEVTINRYETCDRCKGKGAEPGTEIVDCEECSGTGQKIRLQRTPLGQIQTATICPSCQGSGKVPEKKCKTCHGETRMVRESSIHVKIPAGIHDKATLRVSGKGEAGLQGGPSGDLFVHVSVTPSKRFERVGDDLKSTASIHVLQAVLGDEIPVQTVHGEVILKIPAGTESGKIFKLKEKGVPHVNGNGKGDHYVKIIVEMPQKLSKKERELYEALTQEAKLDIKPQSKGIFG